MPSPSSSHNRLGSTHHLPSMGHENVALPLRSKHCQYVNGSCRSAPWHCPGSAWRSQSTCRKQEAQMPQVPSLHPGGLLRAQAAPRSGLPAAPGASSRNGHEAGVGEVAVTHSRAVSSCSATTRTNVVGNPTQCLPLPMEMGTGVGSTMYKPSHREKWGAGDCQGPDLEGGWKPQASGQGATCV